MTAFTPDTAKTVLIDVSGSSQRVKIADDGRRRSIRIMNNGTATAWVDFGDVTVSTAVTTGFPVGPGVTEVVEAQAKNGAALYATAIAAGATGKIYFTPGSGI